MNAERLLAHYERIADTPDAIARLRGFVLDLAVRGKLVPQNLKDEPASELLKQITAEKMRLTKAGKFRDPISFVLTERKALPFQPPAHWSRARLIDISRPSYGFAFSSDQFNSEKRGMPLIRIRDISSNDTEACFEGKYDPAYLVTAGDYLVGMDGDFNLRKWNGNDGLLNQRVMRINDWKCGVVSEYVKIPLQFVLKYLHGNTSLTTVKHLSAKQVNGIEIPLPPVAEQHRIVAKVDELMALCDRLEAARAEREATRDRLAASTLARLNTPDPATFQADARFALNTIPALTTRPDQIKQLRQTILNLAVRGKLVPQDPKDEDAAQLIKRIIKAKRILGKSSFEPIQPLDDMANGFDAALELPRGWSWVRLDQIAEMGTGLTPSKANNAFHSDGDIPWINSSETSQDIIQTARNFVTNIAVKECRLKVYSPGSLIIALYGQGKTRGQVAELGIWATVNQACAVIQWIAPFDEIKAFVRLTLDQQYESMRARAEGGPQPNLNVGKIKERVFAFPPIAEQYRIVAKVDALMKICDQLETILDHTATTRRSLLDALLAEALAPAKVRELEAAE